MRSSYDKTLEAIGRIVGGMSTKIHAKVDSLGQLVSIILTPGQVIQISCAREGADRSKPRELCIFRVSVLCKKTSGTFPIHLDI